MRTQTLRRTLGIIVGVVFAYGEVALAQTTLVDPPDRVARLSYVEGAVTLAPAAADEWVDAVLNRPLTTGDRLWVDAASRAELQVDNATIHVDANSSLSFVALDDASIRMRLTEGTVVVHVRSVSATETIAVDTNNATVWLRRNGEYTIASDASDQTVVKTWRGESDVSGTPPQSYLVGATEQAVFAGEPLRAEWLSAPRRNSFELWANARESQQSRSVGARYVSTGTIGYQDLDAYGSWLHEAEYGYVWRPTTVVVRDWAPYRYGRWVWVSPWGWTWVDDAPWGFAPFHYGRWAYVRSRWCWVPGPPRARAIYAPALVAWAGDPRQRFNHVGWFPLGPRDIYLPGYQATWRHFRGINAGPRFDDAALTNAYHGHHHNFDYRNRTAPYALTVVSQDTFKSGHRTRGAAVRVDANTAARWRENGRTPDIQPDRRSVLGAEPARRPPVALQQLAQHKQTPKERGPKERGQSHFRGDRQERGQSHFPASNGGRRDASAEGALTPFPVASAPAAPQRPSWTSRHERRAAEPRVSDAPQPPSRPMLGYAKPTKPARVPAEASMIAGPELPAAPPARVQTPRRHEQRAAPAERSAPVERTAPVERGAPVERSAPVAPREWAAAPGVDGPAPIETRPAAGRGQPAREPGGGRSFMRGGSRGGDASPLDTTQ